MKKKLLIGTVLPALAAAAVVGSGFAYWIFDANLTTEASQNNIGKEVTQMVKIGSIKVADAFTLVFDQQTRGAQNNTQRAPEMGTLSGELSGTLGNPEGIHVEFSGENPNTKVSYEQVTGDEYVDIIQGKTVVAFDVEISLTKEVAAYVDITSEKGDVTKDDETGKYTFDFEVTDFENTNSFDWLTDIKFSYAENMEPKNETDYLKLRNLVLSESTTFSAKYSAVILKAKNN